MPRNLSTSDVESVGCAGASARRLFLVAYATSGAVGLIYEVTWTRLLTLHLGHTTAAASTVAAAFMGGLAAGAFLAGRLACKTTMRRALQTYIGLELFVAVWAVCLPALLSITLPTLAPLYRDGAGGMAFAIVRLLLCLLFVLIPAVALGATFPIAVRWFTAGMTRTTATAGALYAANTAGAAMGAYAAGFVLLPRLGTYATALVGVAGGLLAAAAAFALTRSSPPEQTEAAVEPARVQRPSRPVKTKAAEVSVDSARVSGTVLASVVLGISGFASLAFEIGWIRVLSLLTGPTTYAFAAVLGTLIASLALGTAAASWLCRRTTHAGSWLAGALVATAVAMEWMTIAAGGVVPRYLYGVFAKSSDASSLVENAALIALMIAPVGIGLGMVFPFALEVSGPSAAPAGRVGTIYAVNTIGALLGALAVPLLIPRLSLEPMLIGIATTLLIAAAIVVWALRLPRSRRVVGACAILIAAAIRLWAPAWDRALIASGIYKFGLLTPGGVDPLTTVRAGRLLYYRDGAGSTVSVKRLTGTVSLSIDGKVDASSSGDMLTQKLLAHLPLLLHPNPQQVLVIGLGSGVTAASALVHPIARLDVVELSPEVVKASALFSEQNREFLNDARTNLIVGDGRSHILLARRRYDVIVSEPSNPWMAGVSALFTREFFTGARERLAPGGVICQWAHTYDISDTDLRSIVATFASVFPNGSMWLIGDGDVLLVASSEPLDTRLAAIEHAWQRPGVEADLERVSVGDTFSLLSQYVAGPAEMARYADGAAPQTDDRQGLEFSGPRALRVRGARNNAASLRALLRPAAAPAAVRDALAHASPREWRNRGAMFLGIDDYSAAYSAFAHAVELDPTDAVALDGFVRAAGARGEAAEAIGRLNELLARNPRNGHLRLALSRAMASAGRFDEAVAVLEGSDAMGSIQTDERLVQIASVLADAGAVEPLERTLAELQRVSPDAERTQYFAGAAQFLRGHFDAAAARAERCTSLDRTDAAAFNLLGVSRASGGQRAQAREAFLAALTLTPRDSTIYVNLGLLMLAEGRRVEAAAYFTDALSLDPGSTAAKEGLAQTGADP